MLTVLVLCDVFGDFIRLDITLNGVDHDRMVFNNSAPCLQPELHFTDGEWVMSDSGFQGDGPIVFPFKKNQGLAFAHRGRWNRDIRKQRRLNEWGIGAVNNRWRLFLERWYFVKHLFPSAYETGVLLVQWNWQREDRQLVSLERRLERLESYEATDG
jgi:DDE superfamily endonuclease